MKMFVEDMPNFEYQKESLEYLDKKMEEIYKKNTLMLTQTEDTDDKDKDMEEIDAEEAEHLLGNHLSLKIKIVKNQICLINSK